MFVKYVRDPIFGYIGITDVERRIIDTLPVQRLRRIKQLSLANITYPGGDHSRFSHSLGTMYLAGRTAEKLRSGVEISDDELQLLRLGGLLHDVGHGPFSHSYEEVLLKYRSLTHEDVGKRVIKESELADALDSVGFESRELVDLIFGNLKKKKYLNQVIASQVDVDKMDFLSRDSYFTGVEYGNIDVHRLIQAMEVMEGDLAVDLKALHALEAFMIARYEMFLSVYYHHSVRAAEIMLNKAMDYANEILGLANFDDINDFLSLDDAYVLSSIRRFESEKFKGKKQKNLEKAKELVDKLDRRKLLKPAYTREIHIDDEYVARLLSDESTRHKKEEEIAKKANVEPEQVTVDAPTLVSVPYYPREIEPMEVPVIKSDGDKRELVPLSERSRLINVLKGYVDVIRVYTQPEYRNKVRKAAKDTFRELPFGAKVSM